MKYVRFLIITFISISIFEVLAFAQIEKEQGSFLHKVAVINSKAFKNKDAGIKEISDACEKVETEFKPYAEKLKLLAEEVKKRENGLKYLTGVNSPTNEEVNLRVKQYEIAVSNLKNEQEKAKSFYEKRTLELTADINKKIREVANLFVQEKGYALILDVSKIDESFIFTKSERDDVTEEFIKYYKQNFAENKAQ